jgi:hypothetical protein
VESLEALKPFNHLEADFPPGPQGPHPGHEVTGVGLIRPDQPQPGEPVTEGGEEMPRGLAVLPVGRRDHDSQESAEGVDHEMPLASVDLLVCVNAVDPPCSVVLTA